MHKDILSRYPEFTVSLNAQETVDAYKQQNVFLSREIMELHQLRTADAEAMCKLRR